MWRNWKVPNVTMPRVDVPEFTRCCFCVPLRYGLLVWGYLKMILLIFLVYQFISDMLRFFVVIPSLIVITILVCIDIVFTLIFIVAGHLKHPLLYRVYYYYCIGLLVAYLLILISFIVWNWYGYYHYSIGLVIRIIMEIMTAFLPVLFVQVYVALLVRTEARKLTNNSNFEFVNNTAEATCSMDMPGTNNVATIPI